MYYVGMENSNPDTSRTRFNKQKKVSSIMNRLALQTIQMTYKKLFIAVRNANFEIFISTLEETEWLIMKLINAG